MIGLVLWFAGTFVGFTVIVAFLEAVEALWGPKGATVVMLAMLVMVAVDILFGVFPETEPNNYEFVVYVAGVLAAVIFSDLYVKSRIKERLQVDGEPRFE